MARKRYGFAEGFQQSFQPALDEALRAELQRLAQKPQTDLALQLGKEQLASAQTANQQARAKQLADVEGIKRGGEDFLTSAEQKAYESEYQLTPGILSGVRKTLVDGLLSKTYTDPTTGKAYKLGPGGKLVPPAVGASAVRTREQDLARMKELADQMNDPNAFKVQLGQGITAEQMAAERARASEELNGLLKQYGKPTLRPTSPKTAPTETPTRRKDPQGRWWSYKGNQWQME